MDPQIKCKVIKSATSYIYPAQSRCSILSCAIFLSQAFEGKCSFSFGGRGIYFGGKDVMLSELSGAFAMTAEAGQADKQGVFKSARITMQFGGAHLASAQRCTSTLLCKTAVRTQAKFCRRGILAS